MARVARVWCVRAPGSPSPLSQRSASETETVTYRRLFLPHFLLPEREFSPATPSLRAENRTPGKAGDGTPPPSRGIHVAPVRRQDHAGYIQTTSEIVPFHTRSPYP